MAIIRSLRERSGLESLACRWTFNSNRELAGDHYGASVDIIEKNVNS